MEAKWSLRFMRLAAFFGLEGAVLGAHMAGSGSYQFRPIHAHILVVGWLTLFVWGLFYRSYKIKVSNLVTLHGWTAVIGSIGLTAGMWLRTTAANSTFSLIFYIAGGVTLLISFGIFLFITFMIDRKEEN